LIVTTPQLIALALCSLAGIGVGVYGTYVAVQNVRSLWRVSATAPHPRRLRAAMVVTGVATAIIGLTVVGYIFTAFFTRVLMR